MQDNPPGRSLSFARILLRFGLLQCTSGRNTLADNTIKWTKLCKSILANSSYGPKVVGKWRVFSRVGWLGLNSKELHMEFDFRVRLSTS